MSPLTRDEIRFFKREGYLIKRSVLDPELMARARERKWEGAPARMKRDDPSTWFGPFRPDEEHGEECENCRIGFTWKYREPAREPWIVAMLATDPVIFGWVQQLLGRHEVETPERIRGIYCRLPMGDLPPRPTVCHCDVTPDRLHSTPLEELLAPGLGMVGLIADIPPSGGAFTVWPCTHRIIHDLLRDTEGLARNAAYMRRIVEFNADPRVEVYGAAGRYPHLAPAAGAHRGLEPVAADPASRIGVVRLPQTRGHVHRAEPLLRRHVAGVVARGAHIVR